MSVRLVLLWSALVAILFPTYAAAATLTFLDHRGQATTSYAEGATVVLRVEDSGAAGSGSVTAALSSLIAGDSESLELAETDSQGVFEGSIRLDFASYGAVPGDGLLQTLAEYTPTFARDTIQADYGAASAAAGLVGSFTRFVDLYGQPTTAFAEGEPFFVEVEDHFYDLSGAVDVMSIEVYLASAGPGGGEMVDLRETGSSTGIFRGLGNDTQQAPSWPVFGDVLEAVHDDGDLQGTTSQGNAQIEGSAIFFLDADGRPTQSYPDGSAATVRVIDHGADTFIQDWVDVSLSTAANGDSRLLGLPETESFSGIFEATIDLQRSTPPLIGDLVLETSVDPGPPPSFDTVVADYTDSYGSNSSSAGVTGTRVWFLDEAGRVVTSYAQGERVYLRVEDHTADLLAVREHVEVELVTDSGDNETFDLEETGFVSGVFEGSLPLAPPGGYSQDAVLQAAVGDDLSVSYTDAKSISDQSSATVAAATLVFLGADGLPTDEILEAGGPAVVRVTSPADNLSPTAADFVTADLTTRYSADGETVTLTETGPDTGVFTGSIDVASGVATTYNLALEMANSDYPLYQPEEVTATFGGATAKAGAVLSRIALLDSFGNEIHNPLRYEDLRVRVVAPRLDNPAYQDSIFATVRSPMQDDSEMYYLDETGLSTGVFEGTFQSTTASSTENDGFVSAEDGDLIEIEHTSYYDVAGATTSGRVRTSRLAFLDAAGQPAEVYLQGERAYLRAASADEYLNPYSVDNVTAFVRSELAGDEEALTLVETGAATRIFEGSIETAFGSANSYDGVVQVTETLGTNAEALTDTLKAEYSAEGPFKESRAYAGTLGSRVWFIDAAGNVTDVYAAGTTAYVRVEDQNFNQPGVVDVIWADVEALGYFDLETIFLTEVDADSGLFEGSLPLTVGSSASQDGQLRALSGEQIKVTHNGAGGYSRDTALATVLAALVEFIDAAGQTTDEVLEADYARLRVTSAGDNVDVGVAETVVVDLTTLYLGDYEQVTLTETGADTGVFAGSIPLSGPWVGYGTGVLETGNSGSPQYLPEQITAAYQSSSAVAHTVGSRIVLLDDFGQETATYPLGALVHVRVFDQNRNDPSQVDSFSVTAEVPAESASEPVTVTETGFNTGVFDGSIRIGGNVGELYAVVGDTLQATHSNYNDPGTSTATATVVGSAIWFLDAAGQPTDAYLESSRAYVRVVDASANVSIGIVETIAVDLTTELSGDFESFTLTETGAETGVFEGSIPLSIDPASTYDDVLQTVASDTLYVSWTDSYSQTVTDSATTFGSRTTFIDAYGNGAETYATGSTVYVRVEDQNANQPGVFDYTAVTLTSLTTGDTEVLVLAETGKSSGVFEGSIQLQDSFSPSPSDGLLQATYVETIEVTHDEVLGSTQSSDQAQVTQVSIVFVDANGVPTDEVLESDFARLRVFSLYGNVDPGQVDTVFISVRTLYAGDWETANLFETGADTGVFEGSIRLSGPWILSGPGTLETVNSGSPQYLPEQITAQDDGVLPPIVATAHTVGSRTAFIDGYGQVTATYPLGGQVTVRVVDQNQNEPLTVNSLLINVNVPAASDSESVTLVETGFDTGVFEGSLPLGAGPGQLDAVVGDSLVAAHYNYYDPFASTATATVVGSAVWFVDAEGELTDAYMQSSRAYVRVDDAGANFSAGSVDSISVNLTTELSGDFESLTLTETGADTGVFEGSIELSIGPSSPDGVLQTTEVGGPPHESDTLYVSWTDSYGQTVTDSAGTFGSRTTFIDAYGNEVESYGTGDTVYVRVEDQNANQPGVLDYTPVTLTSPATGDSETVVLAETGESSGVFEGSIRLQDSSFSSPSDGYLQAVAGETIAVAHDDTFGYTQSSDQAQVDQASVVFIDADGVPTDEVLESDWARVRVFALADNSDPGVANHAYVSVSTLYAGDNEMVELTETGADTSVFEGSIRLSGPWILSGPGTLETINNGSPEYLPEEITAAYDGLLPGITATAHTVAARADFLDLLDQPTAGYALRSTVRVRVMDQNLNEPSLVNSFLLTISSSSGDSEDVTLTETGADTGIFVGELPSTELATAPSDGTLTAAAGDTTQAAHAHYRDPGSTTATATFDGNFVPDVVDDSATANPGVAVVIDVLANDSDPEAQALAVVSVTQGSSGSVAINPDNTVTYTPNPGTTDPDAFTYVAADPQGGQARASVTVAVNSPPTVTITAPADGSVFETFTSVSFTGTAGDPEDGDLTASISWTSDLDGAIGTGGSFSTSSLSAGVHTITATVLDSNDASATDSITVTINWPPYVAITAPVDGSIFETGSSVSFNGTAADTEDGVLTSSISWTSDLDGAIGTGGSFSTSSLSVGVHTITASVTDSGGAPASDSITVTINTSPTVTITSPADGLVFETGSSVSFAGTATDPEDGVLTSSLSWTSSINGAIGTSGSFSTSSLSVGVHTITASVTDSNGAPGSDSITVTINTSPTVTITSPADGSVFGIGSSVSFTGTASDPEDGVLTSSLAWTSSLDGAIGTGGSFSTSGLSAGVHTITASVTDSNGVPGSDAITVTINAPPAVTITSPANGSVFSTGTAVGFTGTASDPEEGNLAASLSWTSSLDGAIGTGGSFSTSSLSLGVHTITAAVTDSHGAPGSAAITVTINAPPVVTITAPADGSKYGVGDDVAFSGSAVDVEDGDLGASLTWTSDLDGVIGSGGTFNTTSLSVGTHLVTASVTDSYGTPGSAAVTVIVKVPVQVTLSSIGVEDGWVLESSESSNVGGQAEGDTSDQGIRAGDDRRDKQYKGLLSFDTSGIPDAAILRTATLRLRRESVNGTDPFNTHGALTADVRTGGFSGSTALEITDFEAAATAAGVATMSNAAADGDWSEGTLDAAGLTALDLTGTTQLRISFALDDNDDRRNDYIEYSAGENADPTSRPQLVVEYLD